MRKAPGKYVNAISAEILDGESLVKKLCTESKSGRIVVQARVANHGSLVGTITTGALATVRVVTCRTPSGSIDLLPPAIRMPYGRSIVDNVAQGGLAAPVDIATGKICGPAIRKDKRLAIVTVGKHPDTCVSFVGVQLPFWEGALNLAVRAHMAFPSMHSSVGTLPCCRTAPSSLKAIRGGIPMLPCFRIVYLWLIPNSFLTVIISSDRRARGRDRLSGCGSLLRAPAPARRTPCEQTNDENCIYHAGSD